MPILLSWSVLSPAPPAAGSTEAAAQALPRDIALNLQTGELDMQGGDLYFTRGAQAVAQSLWMRLRFFLEEWFLDANAGTPWFQDVFVKAPREETIRAALRERILGTTDVTSIRQFNLDLDGARRELSADFIVETPFGAIASSLEASP